MSFSAFRLSSQAQNGLKQGFFETQAVCAAARIGAFAGNARNGSCEQPRRTASAPFPAVFFKAAKSDDTCKQTQKNAPGKFPFRARYLTNQLMRPFARFAALAAGASGVIKNSKFALQCLRGKTASGRSDIFSNNPHICAGLIEDIACAPRNASILISPNAHKE